MIREEGHPDCYVREKSCTPRGREKERRAHLLPQKFAGTLLEDPADRPPHGLQRLNDEKRPRAPGRGVEARQPVLVFKKKSVRKREKGKKKLASGGRGRASFPQRRKEPHSWRGQDSLLATPSSELFFLEKGRKRRFERKKGRNQRPANSAETGCVCLWTRWIGGITGGRHAIHSRSDEKGKKRKTTIRDHANHREKNYRTQRT